MSKRKEESVCRNCNKTYHSSYSSFGFYCSNKCQGEFKRKNNIKKYLNNEIQGWYGRTRQLASFVREYILNLRGSMCEICKWSEVHPVDKRPLVEIDHIDGDAENCRPENLRILCPNHHAMTSTFRNRNKNSKRQR